jgi:Predicted membrane protein
MSGFFGFSVDSVDWSRVRPIGYKIMLEVFMNLKDGSRKTHLEYPYGFREAGKSKLKPRIVLQFLLQIFRLNQMRFIEFMTIGIAGIFISEGLLYAFHAVTILPLALFYSIVISTVVNFLLNHYITFKSRSNFFGSFVKFGIVTLFAGMINFLVAIALSSVMAYLLANFIGIVISFVFKYALSEDFVWRIKS